MTGPHAEFFMKQKTILLISALLFLIGFASAGLADEMYVGDVKKLNVRSGSTTTHKIISTLLPGDKVEVISFSGGWSQIKTEDGKQGWMISRSLTSQKPASARIENLQIQMEIQREQAELNAMESSRLKEENTRLTTRLNETETQLKKAQDAFQTLQTEAADYLSIKKKYDRIAAQADKKDAEIQSLKGKLNRQYVTTAIKWTLTGAGILLVGVFLGSQTRRRRSSLL